MKDNIYLDNESNLDLVTKLNNMSFFTSKYNEYLTEFPNSKLIFIDFAKLKRINDEFTHEGGNKCLNSFGVVVRSIFHDSLIARKHGDEFLILTKHSISELDNLFKKCKQKIQDHFDLGLVPVLYSFNAGVVPAEHGINPSIEKADIMMYEAKKLGLTYIDFDNDIYKKAKENQKFVTDTSSAIKNNQILYGSRIIHDVNKQPTNILDVFARDPKNQSLFTDNRIKLLAESSELKKLDYLNLRNIILSSTMPYNGKTMINIHANSLFNSGTPFPRFFQALANVMTGNPSDYIICVNVSDFNNKMDELIHYLELMQSLGFEIGLSGFDLVNNNQLLNIWPKIDAKFVKVNPTFWKQAQLNPKYASLLKYNIPAFIENNTLPIFMRVEEEKDLDFIRNVSTDSLIEGNIVDKEKKLF